MQPSMFSLMPSLLPFPVVEKLRSTASKLQFDERPDSVDGEPAHEYYVFKDGVVQHAHLADLVKPAVRRLRSHLVDHSRICKQAEAGCIPCTCLIRRYRPLERRAHYEHVDGHAAATAVISLSSVNDYQGGFFLSNLTTRRLLRIEAGDAVVHASDLFHGVDVTAGERWSLVVWFRTCMRCTMAGSSEWYAKGAIAGEPFAAFLHASRSAQPLSNARERAAKAVHWYNISAHAGFAPSMHRLGNAYAAGEGVPAADLRQAAAWLERAVLVTHSISSHQGTKGNATLWGGPSVSSRAAFDLAKLLLRGVENGWPSPFPDEAVDPRERAAELLATAAAEGHARAQQTLAMLGRGECDGSSAWSSGVLGVGVSGGDASAGSRLVVTGTSTTATGRF